MKRFAKKTGFEVCEAVKGTDNGIRVYLRQRQKSREIALVEPTMRFSHSGMIAELSKMKGLNVEERLGFCNA